MEKERKDYHFCSTCIHFRAERTDHGVQMYCARLGYETKSHYKFNCWTPKERILKLLEKHEKPHEAPQDAVLHDSD